MKVFLGGTVDGYDWIETVIDRIKCSMQYFNPIVEDYDEKAKEREDKEKEKCDVLLFVITNDIAGVYSIAEATEYAVRRGHRVVFCNLYTRDQTDAEIRMKGSIDHTAELLSKYTRYVCRDLDQAIRYLHELKDIRDFSNNLLNMYNPFTDNNGDHND